VSTETTAIVDIPPPPIRLTHTEATNLGMLCGCGDAVAGATAYDDHGAELVLPRRDDGARRGRCQCFRARLRQTPLTGRRR
jgi:hypothetical protein